MPLPIPRLPPVIRAVRLRSGTVAPGNSGALSIMNFVRFGVRLGEKGLATEDTESQGHRERRARRTTNRDSSFRSEDVTKLPKAEFFPSQFTVFQNSFLRKHKKSQPLR